MSASRSYLFSDDPCDIEGDVMELMYTCPRCGFSRTYYTSEDTAMDEVTVFMMNIGMDHFKTRHPDIKPTGLDLGET